MYRRLQYRFGILRIWYKRIDHTLKMGFSNTILYVPAAKSVTFHSIIRSIKERSWHRQHKAIGRFLCFRIGAFSFIGYSLGIAGASFLDPMLQTHVRYGPRNYPHAWVWWLLSPFVFVVAYFSPQLFRSKGYIFLSSFAPLVILGGAAAFSFPPERPHMGILTCTFGFALISLVLTWFHFSLGDFAYIKDTKIPFESRLERVKATVTVWQMIAVYAGAGYLAFVVSWIYALWFFTEQIVSGAADRFTLGQANVLMAVVASMCVVLGPILEAFSNAFAAMAQLSKVMK